MSREQLTALCRPFPSGVIHTVPGGFGRYVSHHVVEQRLLLAVGPVDTEVKTIMKDTEGRVDAIVLRMTATIDGRGVSVEEVGDCENPSNWKTNGARLKDAMSDGYKRCAMRLGVGLHLWFGDKDPYVLADQLVKRQEGSPDAEPSRD